VTVGVQIEAVAVAANVEPERRRGEVRTLNAKRLIE
jgi:hypothetical protein